MVQKLFLILSLPLILTIFSFKSHAESPSVIRIGAPLPLTGNFSSYGKGIQDGIEFARAKLQSTGIQTEAFYEDVPLPNASAIHAIQRLVSERHINGIAGNFWNPAIPAMAPVIRSKNLPTFHTAIADDHILNAGSSIFSTNGKIRDEAMKLAQYATETLKAKTAAVLYVTTNWGDNYATHFASNFKKFGGEVVSYETSSVDSFDFRSLITKVKQQKPEVIFTAYFGPLLGVLLKQIHEAGITTPIIATYETADDSVIKTAGKDANGVIFFSPEPSSVVAQALSKEFFETYGYSPGIFTKNAYDATMLLVTSLRECSLTPACTNLKISSIRNYQGMSGIFSIDSDGAAKKEFVLKEVRDGKFE